MNNFHHQMAGGEVANATSKRHQVLGGVLGGVLEGYIFYIPSTAPPNAITSPSKKNRGDK